MNLHVHTYAIAERAEIDLTLSENRLGPSPGVIRAIRRSATASHQYPIEEKQLIARIARRHGISEECILLGAGANGLLEDYLQVLALGKNIVAPNTTFPESVARMETLQGTVSEVPLNPDFSINLQRLLEACSSETRLIHLCNPNNPTGMWTAIQEIVWLSEQSPVPVLVSEAGGDWIGRTAICQKMPENLIVVKSFSKAYGLAGLRIGYSVAQPHMIARMKRSLRSYRVSSLAIAAAIAALEDTEHLQRSIAYNYREKTWLMKAMSRLGFDVVASQGQHFIAKVPKRFRDADHFCAMARERGIAFVNCSLYPGLHHYIRVSPKNIKLIKC
ncbi:MAG: histidinol-phosphate aminotransferase family protein [Parachlamydia sp.]|nr:histidinol-phosphate aminotransferase family protein [Parachlamydia sp.]